MSEKPSRNALRNIHSLWKRYRNAILITTLIIFFIINCILVSSSLKKCDKEILLVHVICRHGHRTPVDTYPNDPYAYETFYPYGWGQLTNSGKKCLFQVGEYLRHRFDCILGKGYRPDVVYAQSTGVTRTRMSLLLLLAGLWPPKHTPTEWSRKLNWQPIPIEFEPLDNDSLLLVRTPCPRYSEALQEVLNSPEIQAQITPYLGMMAELTEITGLNIKTPIDVMSLFNTLKTEEEYGLDLPEWTRRFYPDRLLPLTQLSHVWSVHTEELKRLKGGPFLKKLVGEWMAAGNGTLQPRTRKMFLYVGHDSSVVNVLSALGVWDVQLPDYGVMAMFELLRDRQTGQLGVEMFLKNCTSEAMPLILPGCDFFCPLEKVIELIKPVLPLNREEECKAKNPEFIDLSTRNREPSHVVPLA